MTAALPVIHNIQCDTHPRSLARPWHHKVIERRTGGRMDDAFKFVGHEEARDNLDIFVPLSIDLSHHVPGDWQYRILEDE